MQYQYTVTWVHVFVLKCVKITGTQVLKTFVQNYSIKSTAFIPFHLSTCKFPFGDKLIIKMISETHIFSNFFFHQKLNGFIIKMIIHQNG